MLRIEKLSKTYGKAVALDQLDMTVGDSALYGFVGPNGAGKTTTIKIITGLLQPDEGAVMINGIDAWKHPEQWKDKFGYVPDFFGVYDNLKVCEYMDFFASCYGMDGLKARKRCIELLGQVGLDEKSDFYVDGLSRGMKQKLCLARALIHDPSVLIMDEPTTALNNQEIENLFTIMRRLKGQGVSFIYISHKMPEIFTICDKYTVLRDGRFIETGFIKDINEHQATELLIGKTFVNANLKEQQEPCMGEEILMSVKGLTGETFENVSFDLHRGEVIAITGLQGAGSGELATALFGATPSKSGTVETRGGRLNTKSILNVMRHRVAMIPCNRKERGILPDLSIRDNNSMAYFTLLHKKLIIGNKEESSRFEKNRSKMEIKVGSEKDPITSLSGGNQQKVIVGRWLETDADVMIMDNPTQGIDVGAKYAIYKLILELAAQGRGVLVFSTEFPEIYQIADRCIVMYKGKINGSLEREELNEAGVMALSTGTKVVSSDL